VLIVANSVTYVTGTRSFSSSKYKISDVPFYSFKYKLPIHRYLMQCRSIVCTITSNGNNMPYVLKSFYKEKLVVRRRSCHHLQCIVQIRLVPVGWEVNNKSIKDSSVHVAPACAGSWEGSDHFVSTAFPCISARGYFQVNNKSMY
jgi:hypothetical protein